MAAANSPADHQAGLQKAVIVLKKHPRHPAEDLHQAQKEPAVARQKNIALKDRARKNRFHQITNPIIVQAVTTAQKNIALKGPAKRNLFHQIANLTIVQAATTAQKAALAAVIKKVSHPKGHIRADHLMANHQAKEKALLHEINPTRAE